MLDLSSLSILHVDRSRHCIQVIFDSPRLGEELLAEYIREHRDYCLEPGWLPLAAISPEPDRPSPRPNHRRWAFLDLRHNRPRRIKPAASRQPRPEPAATSNQESWDGDNLERQRPTATTPPPPQQPPGAIPELRHRGCDKPRDFEPVSAARPGERPSRRPDLWRCPRRVLLYRLLPRWVEPVSATDGTPSQSLARLDQRRYPGRGYCNSLPPRWVKPSAATC